MKNCLIAQLDMTFPGINDLFGKKSRVTNGHLKWVDFVKKFWHRDCVACISLNSFSERYKKWCAKERYIFKQSDAEKIHAAAKDAPVQQFTCPNSASCLDAGLDSCTYSFSKKGNA